MLRIPAQEVRYVQVGLTGETGKWAHGYGYIIDSTGKDIGRAACITPGRQFTSSFSINHSFFESVLRKDYDYVVFRNHVGREYIKTVKEVEELLRTVGDNRGLYSLLTVFNLEQ